MSKPEIRVEELRELLHYDQETGVFTWLVDNCRRKAGDEAGSLDGDGYIKIGVLKTYYLAHRLAFYYMTGKFPAEQADHINGIRTDNRWANLRESSLKANTQNRRSAPPTNKSCGMLGVTLEPKRRLPWRARIKVDGKKIHVGRFATPEEAHAAYVAAKRKHHPGCTL